MIMSLFKRKIKNNQKKNSVSKWPDYVITLNNKNFNDFIKKYPFSLIDFWAPWCAPCKSMSTRLRRLSKIYKGKVAFGKIDTQKYQDIAKKNKIMGIPHIIIYNYGNKVGSLTGLKSIGDLKDIIDELLKKNI